MIVRRFGGSEGSAYFQKLSIIVCTAIAILFSALYLLFTVKNETRSESYEHFVEHADRIAENFNERLHADLLALHSFSIAATSYALSTESSWPMITIPDFAVRSWTARQEMKAETLGILPIVTADKREQWEKYSIDNRDWLEQSRLWEDKTRDDSNFSRRLFIEDTPVSTEALVEEQNHQNQNIQKDVDFSDDISTNIYTINTKGEAVVDEGMGPFSPIWMTSPAPMSSKMINFNMLSHHLFWQAIEDCMYSRLAVMSRVLNFDAIKSTDAKVIDEPMSSVFYPVFETFEENSNLVAIVAAEIYWHNLLDNSLPDNGTEVICVVESACGQIFSFKINGPKVSFLGLGDYHDPLLSSMVQTRSQKELIMEKTEGFKGSSLDPGHCPFLLHIYPASRMEENQSTLGIISLVLCLLAICVFPISLFFYLGNASPEFGETDIENAKADSTDGLTRQRTRSTQAIPKLWKKRNLKSRIVPQHTKDIIEGIPEQMTLIEGKEEIVLTNSTMMVAGLCSLEKWMEGNEPEETEHLLESVQHSILVVAKRHGILQVEMIDGNFIAIVGSNDNDIDHAAILVRFACECRKRVSELFKSMAAKELSIRFGIHSGNLIPEVTNNDNGSSRFQLFGDTVDSAYQMLEHGKPNRIQVSVDTAELLNLAGKPHWISPRSDLVPVKGIGNMSTFWVKPKACLSTGKAKQKTDDDSKSVASEKTSLESSFSLDDVSEKDFQTLVDQNTAILLRYLRAIYAKRLVSKKQIPNISSSWESNDEIGSSIIEEARETIQAPNFDFSASMNAVDPSLIQVSQEVQSQLRFYVASIGAAYRRENQFHNFQYASHTVLAMDQMVKKMTCSANVLQSGFDGVPRSRGEIAKELDSRTFSIHSDPIIQFAIIFSALIQDVDHMGVSNQQLINNGSPLSTLYMKRCISEQNAVDISWWLLMKEDFDDLRSSIFSNSSERRHFRQVVINSVIATDVLDSKMKQHRESNWKKAFTEHAKSKRRYYIDPNEKRNLQVTSIVECLMQVADSSFRNQSYASYLKWNERLFEESFAAYHDGRLEENPATHWYESELSQFDDFFIPLVSRVVGTGIFGGSGDSYLTRALKNRDAWKSEGEGLVQEMVNRFSRKVVAVQEDTIHFS